MLNVISLWGKSLTIALLASILTARDSSGLTPQQEKLNRQLMRSIRKHDVKTVLEMLQKGADPNTRQKVVNPLSPVGGVASKSILTNQNMPTSLTPLLAVLHVPLSSHQDGSHVEYDENEQEHTKEAIILVKALLRKGAHVNVQGDDGKTPLIWAAATGKTEVVRLLLRKGSTANTQDNTGQTALHWAVYEEQAEVVRLLLSHHAAPNIKDKDGYTPLGVASHIHHYPQNIISILHQNGAVTNPSAIYPR